MTAKKAQQYTTEKQGIKARKDRTSMRIGAKMKQKDAPPKEPAKNHANGEQTNQSRTGIKRQSLITPQTCMERMGKTCDTLLQ